MTEFKAFWQNYVNFSDRTTRRGYWMAFLFLLIANIIVGAIVGITGLTILTGIWGFVYLLPLLAIWIRRLRDAGMHWAWIFINIIPVIGWIAFIVFLCRPSAEQNGTPVV